MFVEEVCRCTVEVPKEADQYLITYNILRPKGWDLGCQLQHFLDHHVNLRPYKNILNGFVEKMKQIRTFCSPLSK